MNPLDKLKILIVDDEDSVRRFLRHTLEANQFQVLEGDLGRTGLIAVAQHKPDLILLDYGLPDMSGLEALKELRRWSKIPVILLTVRDAEEDKVAALDAGADDYLTKPFGVPEFLARIRVALRHSPVKENSTLFHSGPLEIDHAAHVVKVNGHVVKLTRTEYDILTLLSKSVGRVVGHKSILKEIWGPHSLEQDHYLRIYFSQIRKKLDRYADGVKLIENESGVGYRLRLF